MQAIMEKKQRNNSIDLFRYLCAVLVVIIHSSFWRQWGTFGYFLGEILTRIAVPFFFAVSGYFFIQKLEIGKPVFWKQFWHLLSVYAVWSFVYLLIDFKNQVLLGEISVFSFFREFLFSFFIFGSQGHFWFFPAIIISSIIVALAYGLKLSKMLLPASIILYLIGCLGCSYFGLGVKIPILGKLFEHPYFTAARRIFMMGLPFFCSGLLVLKLKKALKRKKSLLILWICSVAFFLAEIFAVNYFQLAANIIITVGLYCLLVFTLLLLLQYPLSRWGRVAPVARSMANITYYSHPLFLLLFSSGLRLPAFFVFLASVFVTGLLGLGLHFILARKNFKLLRLFVG